MTTLHASTTQPKEAAYIVYLSGIEVPVMNAIVHMEVGDLPSATVTVAPDLTMVQLGKEDRVEVQIFYKDDIHTAVEGKAPDFRLMFDGVISGWSYVNSARSRSIQFSCVHASQVLKTLNPYFITGPNSMAMNAYAAPEGTQATYIQGGPTSPWSMFFYGFNTPEQKTLIKRPYDYIENVFRSCIDIREAPKLGSAVTSIFYSRYMKKFGLPFRFVPSPIIEIEPLSDPDSLGAFPILKAVRSKATLDALYKKTVETGVGGSIWDSIQGIFQQMYYEVLSFSTSPIAQVEMTPGSIQRGMIIGPPEWKKPTKKQKSTVENTIAKQKLKDAYNIIVSEVDLDESLSLDDTPAAIAAREEAVKERFAAERDRIIAEAWANEALDPIRPNFLINHVTKPQWLFGVPPACNVIFPSMIKDLRFEEDYLNQPTRLYVNDLSVPEIVITNDAIKKALSTIRYGYPYQVDRELSKRTGGLKGAAGNPLVSGKNFLVWPEEFYKGPVSQQADPPGWLVYLQEEFQSNQTVEQKLAREALDKVEQSILDIWTEAYSRAQTDAGQVPPDSFFLNQEEKAKAEAELRAEIESDMLDKLLDKEQVLITKLKEQRILSGDINSVNDLREKLASRANENQAKVQVMMRMLARYEYHRTRSGFQRGSVTMSFNPYIVPGFPAMIFDYFTNGQHFVGYVVSVTHEMSSRGWKTTAQFVHGQTIDEFVNEVFDARVGNNLDGVMEDISAGPPTPIPGLRQVLQHVDQAEDYFAQLFHQGANYTQGSKTKRAAFDFAKALLFIVPGKTKDIYYSFDDTIDAQAQALQAKRIAQELTDLEEIEDKLEIRLSYQEDLIRADADQMKFAEGYTKDSYIEAEIDRIRTDQEILLTEMQREKKINREFTKPEKKLKNKVLDNYVGIRPTRSFSGMFGNHDIAMKYISRPICTLDEYVAFREEHGKRRNTIRSDHATQGKGAIYYEQILNFTADSGEPPTFNDENFLVNPKPKDLADTRKDWSVQLKNYRAKILFGKLPDSPEDK